MGHGRPVKLFSTATQKINETAWRVYAIGELDCTTAPRLRAQLEMAAGVPGIAVIVLDLAGLSFLDAAGVGVLLSGRDRLASAGKSLQVVGAAGEVAGLIELVGADEYLGVTLD